MYNIQRVAKKIKNEEIKNEEIKIAPKRRITHIMPNGRMYH